MWLVKNYSVLKLMSAGFFVSRASLATQEPLVSTTKVFGWRLFLFFFFKVGKRAGAINFKIS